MNWTTNGFYFCSTTTRALLLDSQLSSWKQHHSPAFLFLASAQPYRWRIFSTKVACCGEIVPLSARFFVLLLMWPVPFTSSHSVLGWLEHFWSILVNWLSIWCTSLNNITLWKSHFLLLVLKIFLGCSSAELSSDILGQCAIVTFESVVVSFFLDRVFEIAFASTRMLQDEHACAVILCGAFLCLFRCSKQFAYTSRGAHAAFVLSSSRFEQHISLLRDSFLCWSNAPLSTAKRACHVLDTFRFSSDAS